MAETVMIHMKLPRSIIRDVDHYAADHDLYRNQAVAELIEIGLREMRYDYPPAMNLTESGGQDDR